MLVIGYGVAAIIVLVLLIVFNVRAVAKRSRKPAAEVRDSEPAPQVLELEPAASESAALRLHPPQQSTAAESKDESYRNAMRQWRTQSPAATTPAVRGRQTSDAEYREAMRKLRQSKDRKE